MYKILVILIGKLTIWILSLFGHSATALPGLIILKLYPNFLEETIGRFPQKIIVISGTNGKTTTAHLLSHLLRSPLTSLNKGGGGGFRVFHNAAGSNMERGVVAEILRHISVGGDLAVPAHADRPGGLSLQYDYFVLESDEGALPRFMETLHPQTVVLLNIFRDQMDRYGEINSLMSKWSSALQKYPPGKIIFNADDPNITHVIRRGGSPDPPHGEGLRPSPTENYGFSVEYTKQDVVCCADRTLCPSCNSFLKWQGNDFSCKECGFKKIKPQYILSEKNGELFFQNEEIGQFKLGQYNLGNLAAAITAFYVVGTDLPVCPHAGRPGGRPLREMLQGFTPAFGRNEIIKYKNKSFRIFLAKNPAGMDNVLQTINNPDNLLMCLNDKIADGEDVSWIYDVDFETHHAVHLLKNLIFSGTRAHDLALRLKIAEKLPTEYSVEQNMQNAFEKFLEKVPAAKNSVIILTYTCLMELEKIMYKKKLIKKLM